MLVVPSPPPPPAADDFGWLNTQTAREGAFAVEDAASSSASLRVNPAILIVLQGVGDTRLMWHRPIWRDRFELPPFPSSPPVPFPPSIFPSRPTNPRQPSHNRPMIARSLDLDPRVRRFTELLSEMVNSLTGGGYIVKTSQVNWVITNPPWVEDRAPLTSDDESVGVFAGAMWYYRTIGRLYYCVSESPGAALWVPLN